MNLYPNFYGCWDFDFFLFVESYSLRISFNKRKLPKSKYIQAWHRCGRTHPLYWYHQRFIMKGGIKFILVPDVKYSLILMFIGYFGISAGRHWFNRRHYLLIRKIRLVLYIYKAIMATFLSLWRRMYCFYKHIVLSFYIVFVIFAAKRPHDLSLLQQMVLRKW